MTRNATGWRGRTNQTHADARARIRAAKDQWLLTAHGEYLCELEDLLRHWHQEVRNELVRRSKSNK